VAAFAAARLPTTLVCPAGPEGAERLALALRLGEPAVVARVADGRCCSTRTLPEAQFEVLADAIARAFAD
jgi:hypothetical protein